MSPESPYLRAAFGHHKCATLWSTSILREVSRELHLNLVVYHNSKQFNDDLRSAAVEVNADVVCYTNADQRHVDALEHYRAFHMIRDPRDIVVSAYFSHLHSHPLNADWLASYRARLQSVDRQEGLLLELQRCRSEFRQMLEWNYRNPSVLEVRMEDVTGDPKHWWTKILGFLDIPVLHETGNKGALTDAALDRILDRTGFSAKSGGRRVGEEDVQSHYRKGVSGDWREHFRDVHVDYFKKHYGDLLLTLGYEQTSDW